MPEERSHGLHPGAGAPLDPRSLVTNSKVLVPKLYAPERRRVPAARPCVARVCEASGCKQLRSPQFALRAQPAPPTAPAPQAPAETRQVRPSAPHAPAAERAPLGLGADPHSPRHPAATGGLAGSRRGEERAGETASRRGPSSSRRKARDGRAESLDRPLGPGDPRLARVSGRAVGAAPRAWKPWTRCTEAAGPRAVPSLLSSRQPTRQTKVSPSAACRAGAAH